MDPLFYNPPGVIFQAIHANWPIYPTGHGWSFALRDLANFPLGTRFYQIDDIDKCLLFVTRDPKDLRSRKIDVYRGSEYHVAVWHEDLIELAEKEFVQGVTSVSCYEYDLRKFNANKEMFEGNYKEEENGDLVLQGKDGKEFLYRRPVDTSDEDWQEPKDFALLPDGSIELTVIAYDSLSQIETEGIHQIILNKIQPLLSLSYYDTAIREAVLLIEHEIKIHHNSQEYGQQLIGLHIKKVIETNSFKSSFIKCYRGELRTLFKYIRNDFMHNQRDMSREQCLMILHRINNVYSWLDMIKAS